jgi:hypothetical protein
MTEATLQLMVDQLKELKSAMGAGQEELKCDKCTHQGD